MFQKNKKQKQNINEPSDFLLEMMNVSKSYETASGKIQVLNKINFTIRNGDFFIINGVSGSGKSTFVSSLVGYEKIDEGAIYVNSEKVNAARGITIKTPGHRRICVVSGKVPLIDVLSIRDNILLFAKRGDKEYIKKVVEVVGIEDTVLSNIPARTTRLNQARTKLAQALVQKASLILLDDILGMMDASEKPIFLHMLQMIKQEFDIAVLLMTDDISYVVKGSKILRLSGGKLI